MNNNAIKKIENIYRKKYGLKAFLLGLLTASLLFIPVIIENNGVFMYYGDFNVQEIPFYNMIHDALISGNNVWSSTTDLGSPVLSSYSFYLLGSPFFLLTLLFPSTAVPFLIGPIFILKFGLCSLTAYIYLKRYVKNKTFAAAGGLLYAFSGFSIYNIFFFHFHEPMIIFPLLLYCVDEFMLNDRKGVLALAVFSACTVNYYFFAGMAVFTAVYWLLLVFTNTYKLTLTKLLLFIFEVVLGFAASAFIILPTVLFISGNPRVVSLPEGYGSLVYDRPQKYWYIISSFFFPPEMPAEPNFTPDVDADWASVSGWLPLLSMTAVIGYLQLKKRDWIKKLILILTLSALIPIFNSAFQLLNSSIFYARWYYMFVLILALASVRALEDRNVDWKRAFTWSGVITAGIAVLTGFIPENVYKETGEFKYTKIGLESNYPRYWIYIAIALISLLMFALIIYKFRKSSRKLAVSITAGICIIAVLTSSYIVQTGNTMDGDDNAYIRKNLIGAADSVKLPDIKNSRSDFYEAVDNSAMYLNIPSIQAFHSVVTPSIMKFYKSLDITRDVASEPDTESYGLRGLLSCRYLFCRDDENFEEDGKTKMPGWSYLKKIKGFKIYKNDHFVPMGFMYDKFISKSEFQNIDEEFRSEAFLKAMVLSSSDLLKYSDLTGYTEKDIEEIDADKKRADSDRKFESKTEEFEYGKGSYFEDCERLKKNSCDKFEYTHDGFKAHINNKGKSNLLFFSVPYEEGWQAYVNGKKADIVRSDFGFMSVYIEGGKESDIVFKYNVRGFRIGIIITTICVILYLMYICLLVISYRKRRKNEFRRKDFRV